MKPDENHERSQWAKLPLLPLLTIIKHSLLLGQVMASQDLLMVPNDFFKCCGRPSKTQKIADEATTQVKFRGLTLREVLREVSRKTQISTRTTGKWWNI